MNARLKMVRNQWGDKIVAEKLIVAYRDNSLFRKYVSGILAKLPQGVEVEKIVFPEGTEKEEINRKMKEVFNPFPDNTAYLSDMTCNEAQLKEFGIPLEAYQERNRRNFMQFRHLDSAFSELTENLFVNLEATEIFKKIAFAIIQEPTRVFLVEKKIDDHPRGLAPNKWSELLNELYPAAEIFFVENLSEALQQCKDDERALIIADRHCGIKVEMNYQSISTWPYKARVFVLPFETALGHLAGLGVIDEPFDVDKLFDLIFENIRFV